MRLRNIPGADDVIASSPFVIQDPVALRGNWSQAYPSVQPLHIEIGMGKGQFLMQLAALHPEINYLGIERYSSVLLRAIQKMETLDAPLPNLRFLCFDAKEIESVFAEHEVDKIYLNFSDPWPKDRHAKRRLTSRQYFARYDQILKTEGVVEFKTDNDVLFDFSLEEVPAAGWKLDMFTYDLHADPLLCTGNVMTEYEAKFSALGNPIHKLIASR